MVIAPFRIPLQDGTGAFMCEGGRFAWKTVDGDLDPAALLQCHIRSGGEIDAEGGPFAGGERANYGRRPVTYAMPLHSCSFLTASANIS
jgi:hypothetical protein